MRACVGRTHMSDKLFQNDATQKTKPRTSHGGVTYSTESGLEQLHAFKYFTYTTCSCVTISNHLKRAFECPCIANWCKAQHDTHSHHPHSYTLHIDTNGHAQPLKFACSTELHAETFTCHMLHINKSGTLLACTAVAKKNARTSSARVCFSQFQG